MVIPCNAEQGRPETPVTPPDDRKSKSTLVPNTCDSEENIFCQDVSDDSTSSDSSSISNETAQVAECNSGGNVITVKQCEGPIHIGNNHTSTNIIIADRKVLPQVLAAAENDTCNTIGFNINEAAIAGSLNGDFPVEKKLQRYGKVMAAGLSLVLVLVVVVASLQIFQIRSGNAEGSVVTEDNYDGDDFPPGNVSLITRRECLLTKPAKLFIPDLTTIPPKYVIISHTGTGECLKQKDCCEAVRNIQSFHIRNGYDDIGYQFLIGGDGRAYEGRRWNKTGSHTYKYNCASFGVAFVGNFIAESPRNRQVEAAELLLTELVQKGMLQSNYTLYYHQQLSATESPGQKVIDIVKTWPHWSPDLPNRCS